MFTKYGKERTCCVKQVKATDYVRPRIPCTRKCGGRLAVGLIGPGLAGGGVKSNISGFLRCNSFISWFKFKIRISVKR